MSLHFRYDVTKDDVKVHQRWDKRRVTTVGHDIALIKLPHAVETVNENANGNIVLPICLDWSSSGVCYISMHILWFNLIVLSIQPLFNLQTFSVAPRLGVVGCWVGKNE